MCHLPTSPNILRLPRKKTLQNLRQVAPKQMKRHLQCATDPRPIRQWSEHDPSMKPSSATRLANEVTFHAQRDHFVLKNTTFRAPAIIPNSTKCCTCHEKWHLNFTKYCAYREKWHLNFILVAYEMLFTMRGATCVIRQHHQILRLPRKKTVLMDSRHIWNVIYNARSNRSHPPTSPNTAPAKQNNSHDWSSSHMKRYLQCAEQHMSSSTRWAPFQL